jgi:hypothetical protein
MRTGSHTSRPTPNRRAALASAGAVAERIAGDSHAFAYEGAPTIPAGSTIAEHRAQGARGNGTETTGSQVQARALAVARAGAGLFARRTRVRAELPPSPGVLATRREALSPALRARAGFTGSYRISRHRFHRVGAECGRSSAREEHQMRTSSNRTASPAVVRATGLLALLIAAALSLSVASAVAHTGEQAPSDGRTPAAGAQVLPEEDPARGLTYDGLAPAREGGPCEGLFELRSEEGRLEGCTHGPDPAPVGVDVREARSLEELHAEARTAGAEATVDDPGGIAIAHDGDDVRPGQRLPAPRVPCIGDPGFAAGDETGQYGQSGNRVQAIYAYASDRPGGSRFAQVKSLIQGYAAEVDQVFYESARETGGRRHVRFVHTDSDTRCELWVEEVMLSPEGDDDILKTVSELRAKGYRRYDRKYLVWMDANPSDGFTDYCGIGNLKKDERPIQNIHNGDPSVPATAEGATTPQGMFARVDPQCWGLDGIASGGVSAEAHELMHTLGGVQAGAPNATWNGHCIDESDLMCYDDDLVDDGVVTPPNPDSELARKMRQDCDASHERLFDCNHDDYYNTDPLLPWHEYLTKQWNTADSSFLADRPADRDAPTVTRPIHTLGQLGDTTVPIGISWRATDASGIRSFHLWKQTDGGAWTKVQGVTTILTTTGQAGFWWHGSAGDTLSLAPGHFYKFAVRAVDREGNSGWTYSDEFWFYVHDETSPLISYSGSWSNVSSNNHFRGGTKRTTNPGDKASLTFNGTNIAWVGTIGPGGGHADVLLDGSKVETVSLNVPSPHYRIVLFQKHRLQWGEHTITIRAHGDGYVDTDAFIFDNDTGS